MPIAFYRHMSGDEVKAIIAYLRAQPAVKNAVGKSKYTIALPLGDGPTIGTVRAPRASDKRAYREYLANIGHCMECHTPHATRHATARARCMHDQPGAGGQTFPGPWGERVSRNLTPHPSGLKDWTDAQVVTTVRKRKDRSGKDYRPPMGFGFYETISDTDMAALITYLRSRKPRTFAGK